MIQRAITQTILEDLSFFPVVGIIGPRQVGKTTLAKKIQARIKEASILIDLELDSDLRKLEDAETYLQAHQDKCVIIDEIQRMPRLFTLLRALVDIERRPGRFIILGSASPRMIKDSSETLAGRISYSELTPFSLLEIKSIKTQEEHWLKGGFPDALLAPSEKFTWRWLRNFIRTFIERDLRELGHEISNVMLSRLLSMLSHVQGQLQNASDLSRSLGVSAPTVNHYLDLLEGSFIINRLQPYFSNVKKRLVKSPKIYFRDSGVLHQISNINDIETLLGHIAVGASWEGYVIEQIKRTSENKLEMYFYRTHGGAESDLVLIGPGNRIACIEIKLSNAPSVSKGFFESIKDIGPEFKYVICPHTERYERSGGIIVCGLVEFLEKELLKIYGNTS